MASVEFRTLRKSFGASAATHRVDGSICDKSFSVADFAGRDGTRPSLAYRPPVFATMRRCLTA